MGKRWLIWLHLMTFPVLSCEAFARPEIRLETGHYPVPIAPGQSWAEQVLHASPFQGPHVGLAARTFWEARADFDIEPRDERSCYLVTPRVVIDVQVVLPQLRPAPGVDEADVARWVRWYESLLRHEQGHIDLLARGFEPLSRALARNPAYEMSCDELRVHVAQLVEEYASVVTNMNERYDAQTRHGASEGVIFPFD